jgi:uncharacterized iron-regulated protein
MNRLFIFLNIISFGLYAQDRPVYKIFTKEGKPSDFTALIQEATKADVTFFGELHNNSLAHWLELQVVKDLYTQKSIVSLGMEMFEADDQLVVDEFMNDLIDEKQFLREAKVWDNYATDYKPLVEFAKESKLKVIATNIPRRYANSVYKKGIETLQTLPAEAKAWMAPLPITIDLSLSGYKSMVEQMTGHGPAGSAENMAKSQAVKDATMAHFIVKNKLYPMLHINGSYHSQNFEGIVWYLKQTDKKIKIITLQLVEQKEIKQLEEKNKGLADFIICVPDDITKTY